MTEADLLAERDALLGIAQGPSPRELMAAHPRYSPAYERGRKCAANRVSDGWSREAAETMPIGQKRGPKGRNKRRGETT